MDNPAVSHKSVIKVNGTGMHYMDDWLAAGDTALLWCFISTKAAKYLCNDAYTGK